MPGGPPPQVSMAQLRPRGSMGAKGRANGRAKGRAIVRLAWCLPGRYEYDERVVTRTETVQQGDAEIETRG
ncbi:hypothetical protein AB870_26350 [Pandoraea faecigallinarum]|nr:hypothetical protein AB870_26350 [Pandoraea faecigallinarum]